MVPSANARQFLLKAKQRDLIAAAGGIERAALICSYSKSEVGRWNNADSPDLMELPAIFALEEETGRFDLSEAIASARGRRFADDGVDALANGNLMGSHADAVVKMGELMSAGAVAYADGKLTQSERRQLDRALSAVGRAIEDYRATLAGFDTAAGLSVVGGAA